MNESWNEKYMIFWANKIKFWTIFSVSLRYLIYTVEFAFMWYVTLDLRTRVIRVKFSVLIHSQIRNKIFLNTPFCLNLGNYFLYDFWQSEMSLCQWKKRRNKDIIVLLCNAYLFGQPQYIIFQVLYSRLLQHSGRITRVNQYNDDRWTIGWRNIIFDPNYL